jgi:hypothetical protein
MTRLAPPAPDDDLRELFAPLAADEPPPSELARLRSRSAARPGRRRLPRRTLAAVAAATAAVAVGLALLPGASPPVPGPGPEPAAGVLRAAAAVAADQPVPRVADAPYRYTRTRDRLTYEVRDSGAVARLTLEQPGERWVGVKWSGREAYGQGQSSTSGDRGLARAFAGLEQSFGPREGPVAYGDGPLAELDPTTLPATRDAIAATLREGMRTNRWSPYPESRGQVTGPPGGEYGSYAAYSFVNLLVHARLSPPQRAALLDVLASDPCGPGPRHGPRRRGARGPRRRARVHLGPVHRPAPPVARLRSGHVGDPRVEDDAAAGGQPPGAEGRERPSARPRTDGPSADGARRGLRDDARRAPVGPDAGTFRPGR